MRKLLLFGAILIFNFSIVISQSSDEVKALQDNLGLYSHKYGLFFDYGVNLHDPAFTELKGIGFNNPGFKDVTGSGFAAGLFYEWPFTKKFSVNGRLSLASLNGSFSSQKPESVQLPDGTIHHPLIEYTFNASITSLGLELLASYEIFSGFKFHVGPNFSYLMTATFDQAETIIKADGLKGWVTASNDTVKVWNKKDGEAIPDASIFLSIPVGLSYEIKLNDRFIVTPELFFNYGLLDITKSTTQVDPETGKVSDGSWTMHSFRVGASFGYIGDRPCPPGMYRNESGNCEWEPCPPGMRRNNEGICECKPGMFINDQGLCEWPPCKERNFKRNDDGECKQVLFADIKVEPILPNGLPADTDVIRLKESESVIYQSLLNYIFFDEQSSVIPKKYNQFTNDNSIGSFKENKIADPENPVNTYYNILDIIGYRMSNSPFAKLTLVAYNMSGKESKNTTLPQNRINSVANYLKNIWKVPDYRIESQLYNLPQEILNSDNDEILSEYMRVEIIPDTSNLGIIGPVVISDRVYKAYPPKINFNLDVMPLTQIESWKFKTYQNDEVFFESSGTGNPPAIISWFPNTKSNSYSENKSNMNYSVEIIDKSNEKIVTDKPLPSTWIPMNPDIKPDVHDSTYATYYLLFNFNNKEIDRDIRKNSTVLDEIKFNEYKSRFSLTGFTDRIGDARSNKYLSNDRVEAVAKYLVEKRKLNDSYLSKQGLGYVELFDNNTPEGRYYNRTVILEVSTPLESGVKQEIKLEGCYVIVYSDENEQNATSVLNILKQKGIDDAYIEKYYEKIVDKNYFRVRTPMYKEMRDAVVIRAKISVVVKQMNLEKPPILKCDKD